ncbi:hypothetical protein L6164_010520 [Bauhinia variegata]|uniref:Uncharacterized protein n=1 Tax=Bauhinia variegata TaxID=167791 RepID=A0ACB9PN92_BAUVA|nr:hypothetical protein L6164_010520 [Bauhinia variegata]
MLDFASVKVFSTFSPTPKDCIQTEEHEWPALCAKFIVGPERIIPQPPVCFSASIKACLKVKTLDHYKVKTMVNILVPNFQNASLFLVAFVIEVNIGAARLN